MLGPVEVRGAVRPFGRAASLELVIYLALHPRGATTEEWATALWPERAMAPPTLHSTASAARTALGRRADGGLHLPRRHGRLQLAGSVSTDWERVRRAASSADPGDWLDALRIVRGRPFEGLRSVDWTVLEGHVAEMEEQVVDLALRAGEHLLAPRPRPRPAAPFREDGAPFHEDTAAATAAQAARIGLRVSPYDERLYRLLLQAADRQGNPAGVERVMAELVQLVAGTPPGPRDGRLPEALVGAVHPQTAALYRALSRRNGAAATAVRTDGLAAEEEQGDHSAEEGWAGPDRAAARGVLARL